MSFSNPYAQAKQAAPAYLQHLMDLVGERDPWEIQNEQLEWLRGAVRGLDEARLRTPEKPGKWSVHQAVWHLADVELVYAYRIRMAVAHPGGPIQGFDQDAFANELDYAELPIEGAFEQLQALRQANHRLIRSLPDDKLDRAGVHAERGPESPRHIVRLLAGHDLFHRNQIRRIRQAVGG